MNMSAITLIYSFKKKFLKNGIFSCGKNDKICKNKKLINHTFLVGKHCKSGYD